jgi:integrase
LSHRAYRSIAFARVAGNFQFGDDSVTTQVGTLMAKISKRTIDALGDASAGTVLRDDDIKGFQARRNANGSITYAYEYRAGSGRSAPVRRLTIAKAGNVTPDEARKLAKGYATDVAGGADPAATKAKGRSVPTLSAFGALYLDTAARIAANSPENAKLRPRTIANYRSLIKLHIGPAVGSRRLDTVDRSDIGRLHSAIGENMPMTANRVIELVGSIYRAAFVAGLVPEGMNPARQIKAFPENRRERFLSTEELGRLGSAICVAETSGLPYSAPEPRPGKSWKNVPKSRSPYVIDAATAGALRLLIFSGARLREILHARWSEFDAERGILNVFGKTGRRAIILPAPALAVIADLPKTGDYMIAATDPKRPKADLAKPWRAVTKLSGLEGLRLHDLRHSFASVAVSGGASLPMIGSLLGHSQPQTTARYAHLADNPVRATAERAAGTIAAALEGRSGNVTSLEARKMNPHHS